MKSPAHSQPDIDELLAAAEQALMRADSPPPPRNHGVQSVDWPELSHPAVTPHPTPIASEPGRASTAVRLRIELIRQTLTPTQIAAWRAQESVVLRGDHTQLLPRLSNSSALERASESLAESVSDGSQFVAIYRDDQLVARGELLLLDDHYCCRVTEIIRPAVRRAA